MNLHSDAIDRLTSLIVRGFYSTAFQPISETSTRKTIGYESLFRGPEGTPLAHPGKIFNEAGYVPHDIRLRLDHVSIDSAVRAGSRLPGRPLIFINVLGATILHLSDIFDAFLALLAEYRVDPSRIVLEVSESTDQDLADRISATLRKLQSVGIRVALDDIGVRSPYLYHLLCLEPEFIKLDRIFIRGIDKDVRRQDLVHCMVAMAERMGTCLIAEGVETPEEFRIMQSLGVPLCQGFYLGKPQLSKEWMNGKPKIVSARGPDAVLM